MTNQRSWGCHHQEGSRDISFAGAVHLQRRSDPVKSSIGSENEFFRVDTVQPIIKSCNTPIMKPLNVFKSKDSISNDVSPNTVPAVSGTQDDGHIPTKDPEKQASAQAGSSSEKVSAFKSLGLLDRFLALWIFLAMVIGILLGNFVSSTGPALQKGKFVGVSIPIGTSPNPPHSRRNELMDEAVGLLVMMYPILCKVRYETLHKAFRGREIWVQIAFSVVVNWLIAPFLMVSPPSDTVEA